MRIAFILLLSTGYLNAEEKTIPIFNGKNLNGWTTWLKDTGHKDPKNVFTVNDGIIHISGEGRGYLATKKEYENYHLSLEYKWGKRTDGSGYVRNSGVLLHAVGPHGGVRNVWMASVECQLAQGCEGDFILIRGKDKEGKMIPSTITADITRGPDKRLRWDPKNGKKTKYSGRQFWWRDHQVGFKEKLDTRGKNDAASPLGQWTKVECICKEDRITVKINGKVVNECYDVRPSKGKILLQNEGNEIYFRNLQLRSLK